MGEQYKGRSLNRQARLNIFHSNVLTRAQGMLKSGALEGHSPTCAYIYALTSGAACLRVKGSPKPFNLFCTDYYIP